jgi:2-methylisocitrate lyase-like PEP mutase family enzyme
MDAADAMCKGVLLRDLRAGSEILILPNPWDVGTAKLLANAGFRALATTCAGLAFSLGRRDGSSAASMP